MITQVTLTKWYDEGQKSFKLKTEPLPQETRWNKFLIYGKKLNPSLLDKLLKHD